MINALVNWIIRIGLILVFGFWVSVMAGLPLIDASAKIHGILSGIILR